MSRPAALFLPQGGVMPRTMLSSLPYFRELSEEVLAALETRARRHDLERGVRLIKEGQAAESMFFLSQGLVSVSRQSGDVLDTIAAPTLFGEMAIIADTPRLADVTTEEASTVFEVSREEIAALSRQYPTLRETILSFHRFRLMSNILRSNPLFGPLTDQQRVQLAKGFVSQAVKAGYVLLQERQPGEGLFVLLRGCCEVLHREQERDVLLSELSEGSIFGEISLVLFERMCTATVRAKSDCVVLFLARELFQRHLMANPAVRGEVMKLALERLRQTEQAVAGLSRTHLI
jgi:cAMP-dependent protein kinase regulator